MHSSNAPKDPETWDGAPNDPRDAMSWDEWLVATEPADINEWYELWVRENYPELDQPVSVQEEVDDLDWLFGPVGFVPPRIPMGPNGKWTAEGRQIYDAAYNKWLEEKQKPPF